MKGLKMPKENNSWCTIVVENLSSWMDMYELMVSRSKRASHIGLSRNSELLKVPSLRECLAVLYGIAYNIPLSVCYFRGIFIGMNNLVD